MTQPIHNQIVYHRIVFSFQFSVFSSQAENQKLIKLLPGAMRDNPLTLRPFSGPKTENSKLFLVIGAIIHEAAIFAARVPGAANLPAVPDQVYVGFVIERPGN
jgi:hypothetical protein